VFVARRLSLERAPEIEDALLREFKRRYHHYSLHVPSPLEHLRWFSLMQHYGAPTRLLDWTYSRHVAAYFALEDLRDDDEECAIWAVDSVWARDATAALFHENNRDTRFLREAADEEVEKLFLNSMLRAQPYIASVVPINPFHLDERLTIQKGVFLCPGDVTKTFEKNLEALPNHDHRDNIRKLKIPVSERRKALRDLDDININRATLFPGLDGFAQSLKVYHRSWDLDR
jgi:hypothetical protein